MSGGTRSTHLPRWLWLIPLLLLAAWAASYPLIRQCFPPAGDAGAFGDSFGAANALFSAFALGGVVFAIILQRQELIAQREELELTRRELEGQKLQMQAQNQTMARQAFDSTFFALVRLFNEIAASVEIGRPSEGRYTKGRTCFAVFCVSFETTTSRAARGDRLSRADAVRAAHSAFLQNYGADLNHYFRTLEVILLYLRDSEVGVLETYARVLRAQLSDPELTLLWYHAAMQPAGASLRTLLETNSIAFGVEEARLFDQGDKTLWPEVYES